jgi:ascorbate-specific PTS system EIIC-type component UlaA
MTMRQTFSGLSKSLVGMGLIGLGVFILCGSVADAAAQWSRLVGISADATQTLGELTAVGLALAQVWRSYLFDRRELLLDVWRILISFWPMVLVVAGAVLTGMASESA